ncbi:hypothetical protein, partial [Polymorphobacter multimanifer]|uniref:hypothetical protein n=1 Tax=Polymorphobacter multimanifer TaxID=1070431 RepID=UPI001A9CB762
MQRRKDGFCAPDELVAILEPAELVVAAVADNLGKAEKAEPGFDTDVAGRILLAGQRQQVGLPGFGEFCAGDGAARNLADLVIGIEQQRLGDGAGLGKALLGLGAGGFGSGIGGQRGAERTDEHHDGGGPGGDAGAVAGDEAADPIAAAAVARRHHV